MYQWQKNQRRQLKGFSMLEVLLSVFVLSIGLVAIMAVISKGLTYSYSTRDTIIATELAQEGVELARNARDNDFAPIAGGGHTGFAVLKNGKHCLADWNSPLDCQPARAATSQYYLEYNGGFYGHTGVQERYTRYINVNYSNSGGEHATIRSFVFWGGFDIASIPNNGDPGACDASSNCVHADTLLTAWR